MIAALFKALGQLPDPTFRRVVLQALVYSVVLFTVLVIGVSYGISQVEFIGIGWLDRLVDMLGGAAAFVIGLVLFPGTVALVIGFCLEDIARAVEARHYPDLPPPRSQPLHEALVDALRLAGITILVNLLVLPLYLIPGVNIFVFYGLNGYLLGREYFELVAVRRMRMASVRKMRRTNGGRLILGGVVITFLLSLPVINCLMPVVAAAFMVHLFEGLKSKAGETQLLQV